jgi:RNA polymerase sigma-70 factor (ECF subfamily)
MTDFTQKLKRWVFEPPASRRDTGPLMMAPPTRIPRTEPLSFADERLLEALCARRPGTWLQFYDAFAPYVLSVLRRVLGPDRDLEDLVQEVFTRALSGIARVKAADKLKPWLRSLTVFTARETLRRRKWRAWLPLGTAEDEEDVIPYPTTTDALEERLLLRKVKVVLDALKVDDRLAFALRHFEGLELTEVAETMHLSLSTAKRRIGRAEAEFRRRAGADPDLRALLQTEVQP